MKRFLLNGRPRGPPPDDGSGLERRFEGEVFLIRRTEMERSYFTVFHLAACLGLVWTCLGCDTGLEEQATAVSVSEQSQALEHEAQQEVSDEGEMPDRIVHLEWVDVVGVEERTGLDVLVLRATNTKPFDITVTADVECSGFINRKGRRPLAPHTQRIGPGEEALFRIKADKLPIQSIEGASQLMARVKVRTDSSVSDREWEARTVPFYYRHDDIFKTVTAFNDTALINKYGGILAGSKTERTGTRAVGKTLDEAGRAADIREVDVAAPMYNKEGRFQGTVSAEWVEIEVDPDGVDLFADSLAETDMDPPPRKEE
jgi:hypothetical protein